MFAVGNVVTVKPPFKDSFPGQYAITEIVTSEDGSTAYILGEHGGFDATYLELVP
jgi:hypothetical protein